MKELIISLILATDMEKHHKELEKLKERVQATLLHQKGQIENQPIDKLIEEKAFKIENPKDRKV